MSQADRPNKLRHVQNIATSTQMHCDRKTAIFYDYNTHQRRVGQRFTWPVH